MIPLKNYNPYTKAEIQKEISQVNYNSEGCCLSDQACCLDGVNDFDVYYINTRIVNPENSSNEALIYLARKAAFCERCHFSQQDDLPSERCLRFGKAALAAIGCMSFVCTPLTACVGIAAAKKAEHLYQKVKNLKPRLRDDNGPARQVMDHNQEVIKPEIE